MLLAAVATCASAKPATFELDPDHTYPSFEGDHLGISFWRGKFNQSSGTMVLDTEAGTGSVDVTIDLATVDFGHDEMNKHARSDEFFDVAKYPTATYKGTLTAFSGGVPTRSEGQLTLHGVTRPISLQINRFKCIEHPVLKRPYCGADAITTFQRDAFGLDVGKDWGFDMTVTLRIQVEAIQAD